MTTPVIFQERSVTHEFACVSFWPTLHSGSGSNCFAFAPVFLYGCSVFEFLQPVAQLIPGDA